MQNRKGYPSSIHVFPDNIDAWLALSSNALSNVLRFILTTPSDDSAMRMVEAKRDYDRDTR